MLLSMSCTQPAEAWRALQHTVRQRWMKAWEFTICDDVQHGHRDRRMTLARCKADVDQSKCNVTSIGTRVIDWPCRGGSQLSRLEAAAGLEVFARLTTPQSYSREYTFFKSSNALVFVKLAEQQGCGLSCTSRHYHHNLHALKCPLQCSLRSETASIHIRILSEE